MVDETVKLIGSFGKKKQPIVLLGELTAGDILKATKESERLINTADGFELVESNFETGMRMLCYSIKAIGDVPGSPPFEQMLELSSTDLGLLQEASDKIAIAINKKVSQRGRGSAPAEGTKSDNADGGAGN